MKDEKIFEDELMSDEELDKVAGGDWRQTCDDSHMLYHFGLCRDCYSEKSIANQTISYFQSSTLADADVQAGWKKAGVDFVPSFGGTNKYSINGVEVSRDEAHLHVYKMFGEVMVK